MYRNNYYLYYSCILSLPKIGTLLYLFQYYLIKKNLTNLVVLSGKKHNTKEKIITHLDQASNVLFQKSYHFARTLQSISQATVVLDCGALSSTKLKDHYDLMWSATHSDFVTDMTLSKNSAYIPDSFPLYKAEPTISLLLKTDSASLEIKHQAGTELVFLQDLSALKRSFNNVKAFSRASYQGVSKISFPISLLNVGRKISSIFHLNLVPFFSFSAEIIYLADFLIRSRGSNIFIGYTTPLLALFYPKKTLVVMGNEVSLFLPRLFRKRYETTTFLFCSKFLLQQMARKYSYIDPTNFHLLYNAVEPTLFTSGKKVKKNRIKKQKVVKLLFASAWVPEKGLELLLDALLLLPEGKQKQISLTIASSPFLWKLDFPLDVQDYFVRVNKKIKQLPSVTLLNGLAHHQMPKLYRKHDYLVFPSTWDEPFGLTVLEAQSCNLPVITFKSGAVTEIADPKSTLFAEKKTSHSLAQEIIKAYKRNQNNHQKKSITINPQMELTNRHEKLINWVRETFQKNKANLI